MIYRFVLNSKFNQSLEPKDCGVITSTLGLSEMADELFVFTAQLLREKQMEEEISHLHSKIGFLHSQYNVRLEDILDLNVSKTFDTTIVTAYIFINTTTMLANMQRPGSSYQSLKYRRHLY